MRIDDATLRDLEIFESPGSDASLFALFDRTRTRGGSAALRERFRRPLPSAAEIRDAQGALAALGEHRAPRFADEATADAVERYLASRAAVGEATGAVGGAVEAIQFRTAHRDTLDEIRRGVTAAGEFLHAARAWAATWPHTPASGILAEIHEAVRAALAQPALATAADAPRPSSARAALARDRKLRLDHRDRLAALLDAAFTLDALAAMATVTRERSLVFPEILDDGAPVTIEGEGLIHPWLAEPISNPVALSGDRRLLFLTGPNMAGKTTYLRAVALAVYLAHLGLGVPARRLRLAPLDVLATSIVVRDDLRRGVSYFLAEVRRVREVAEALADGKRCFAVLDEAFKGTNIHDARDATLVVTRAFARAPRGAFIFASHLSELVTDLRGSPGVAFACFEAPGTAAAAPYTLTDGHSTKRLGMRVLESEGIPGLLERIVRAGDAQSAAPTMSRTESSSE